MAVARALALKGCSKVQVLALPTDLGKGLDSGFTARGAGIVSGQFWDRDLAKLAQRSFKIIKEFVDRSGLKVHRVGMAQIALSANHAKTLDRLIKIRSELNWPIQDVLPKPFNERFSPKFRRRIVHATFASDDLWLDPVELARTLRISARTVSFVPAHVREIKKARGLVHMITDRGVLKADRVVLTTGVWLKELVPNLIKARISVHKSQVAIFRVSSVRSMFHILDTSLYSRPCNASTILIGDGDSLWKGRASSPEASLPERKWESKAALQVKYLFGEGSTLEKGWAGLVAMTRDGQPIIGPVDSAHKIWMLTGLGGDGLALAPALGEKLALWMLCA